ncbi:MAG: hypothetical protein IJ658_10780 [Kiritimatiellae bacterium]|nr:hypothetical protein [Kiritimatiellia bacterium]
MKPRHLVVIGFVGAILLGALLLMLPVSSASNTWMKPLDAMFASCSAVCITGLTVVDIGTELSVFGQCVMLALVQLGCVGLMTLGTFFLVLMGRRLSLSSEFSLADAYGTSGIRGLRGLIVWVVVSMLVLESLGTIALHGLFEAHAVENGAVVSDGTLWFRAYFYAVMAFCNAGFSLDAGSLAVFRAQPLVLVTMGLLVTAGGFGFLVVYNLCTFRFWRRNLVKRGRISLHTRVVLTVSVAFLLGTFAAVLLLEWNRALEPFVWQEKLGIAFFQAVTPRTCGFTVVPVHEMHAALRFISEVLMFIGAAPGGAGGGIKVTTFMVFATTLVAICRGRTETVLFKRTVPEAIVREAIVIVTVFASLVTLGMTLLLVSEGGNESLTFEKLLFETVSAVSTTGLSFDGTTASLSPVGRAVLMLCMFSGRLGALAVVLLIGGQESRPTIRYPREELVVG